MRKTIVASAILAASCSAGAGVGGGIGAVACGVSSPGPQSASTMPSSIIDPYLAIQDALADDKTEGVKANAGNIATAATALGAPAFKIDTAAVQLAGAADAPTPDIEEVRQKFGALSEAIDAYATGSKLTMPEGVRVAFCPMANKPWMQKGETLANPYYGKEMPTCGSFR